MLSWSHEYKEQIYRRFLERREKRKEKIEDINLAIIVAEWLVVCFPDLLLPDHKWVLMMAWEMKFDEVKQSILDEYELGKQSKFYETQIDQEIFRKLIDLGVVKPTPPKSGSIDDLPF
jgi:hypothetical protein